MSDIEGLGNNLSGVLHSANAGIEGIQATQPDRAAVVAQLGAMINTVATLEKSLPGLDATVQGLRQGILAGRLDIFEAGTALSDATGETGHPVVEQAIRKYNQAAGDSSAGSNLVVFYDVLAEHKLPRISDLVAELLGALSSAYETAHKHTGHAKDIVQLTTQANDNVRLYALEGGIPLSE